MMDSPLSKMKKVVVPCSLVMPCREGLGVADGSGNGEQPTGRMRSSRWEGPGTRQATETAELLDLGGVARRLASMRTWPATNQVVRG